MKCTLLKAANNISYVINNRLCFPPHEAVGTLSNIPHKQNGH